MSNTTRYRLQLQHMSYERNRQERRRQESMTNLNVGGGGLDDPAGGDDDNNNNVNLKIHQISNHDEGVLYTHMITVSFPSLRLGRD
jgi:hypothetical protein